MSTTVQTIVDKNREIDEATVKIMNIFQPLDDRLRVFVLAMVNQAMNHSFEKMANNKEYEKYMESQAVE